MNFLWRSYALRPRICAWYCLQLKLNKGRLGNENPNKEREMKWNEDALFSLFSVENGRFQRPKRCHDASQKQGFSGNGGERTCLMFLDWPGTGFLLDPIPSAPQAHSSSNSKLTIDEVISISTHNNKIHVQILVVDILVRRLQKSRVNCLI